MSDMTVKITVIGGSIKLCEIGNELTIFVSSLCQHYPPLLLEDATSMFLEDGSDFLLE